MVSLGPNLMNSPSDDAESTAACGWENLLSFLRFRVHGVLRDCPESQSSTRKALTGPAGFDSAALFFSSIFSAL